MPEAGLVVLSRLAGHALSPAHTVESLHPLAVERAAWSLLDLFGCFLGARHLGVNRSIYRVVPCGREGEATLWGGVGRAPAAEVALVAGTVTHHLELDGGWHGPPGVGVHPAVTILPAALAVAEATGASGRELVAAVSAGYDVLAAMATWLCPGITRFGLHPPGLLGAFGATAAVARLLQLEEDQLAGALSWCGGVAPLSPFEAFTAGASAKDLYGGWPGFVGVTLAKRRPPHDRWFQLDRLLGRDAADPREALAVIDEPALLHADFKPYPTCRSVQPALTALESLLAERTLEPRQVAALDVETYPYAVELDESAVPATPIGARTSLKTCLALRLVHGPLEAKHFTPELLADPHVNRLAEATRVTIGRFQDSPIRGAAVSVRLVDGATVSRQVAAAKWSPEQPATHDELRRKFRSLAVPAIGPAAAGELEERTLDLANLASVAPLIRLLAGAGEGSDYASAAPPTATGLAGHLERLESQMAATLEVRGGDPRAFLETLATTRAAAGGLDVGGKQRALSLALCLMPSGAGPLPPEWPKLVGDWSARLASEGFSGPATVLQGRRGLGRLLLGHA